ncbi:MAG: thiamine monophosphate synthase [Pelagibacterales bacterium MED-G41]|nr:MAG: thiamine monophosphate synthase [Pelagibacterales bacterium MED-G41]
MIHLSNVYYFIDKFDRDEILKLDKKINIIFRNYKIKNIDSEIKKIKNLCKSTNRKIFVAGNLKIALKYRLNGLYIPAFHIKQNYANLNLTKDFKIIGSAHNIKEVKIKEKQGCTNIFISPLFHNPKNNFFLGIIKFNLINLLTNVKTIALGGINQNNIKLLKSTKVEGYASITWIKKNRPTIK